MASEEDARRRPMLWPLHEDFNLTALIDSVEKDIRKLEQMEKKQNATSALSIEPVNIPKIAEVTSEDIANLPGYRPRKMKEKGMKCMLVKRFMDMLYTWNNARNMSQDIT